MTMREKMARALCRLESDGETYWESYLPNADAALAAAFEPTDAMKAAGLECFNDGREPDEIYRTMIFAANQ